MRIFKDAITTLAAEGRRTLQVPDLVIAIPPVRLEEVEYEEVPDEWFTRLKRDVPCAGKENGFLYLSRKGYEANKERLKEAFLKAQYKRGTWEQFEKDAEDHFAKVETARQRKLKLLRAKADELERVVI